jgi:hypothetical protein
LVILAMRAGSAFIARDPAMGGEPCGGCCCCCWALAAAAAAMAAWAFMWAAWEADFLRKKSHTESL